MLSGHWLTLLPFFCVIYFALSAMVIEIGIHFLFSRSHFGGKNTSRECEPHCQEMSCNFSKIKNASHSLKCPSHFKELLGHFQEFVVTILIHLILLYAYIGALFLHYIFLYLNTLFIAAIT